VTNPPAPGHGHFVPGQAQQASTNAQTNSVVDSRKLKALRELPLDELKNKAEAGDAGAQHTLGIHYHDGEGVPQDDAEALRWERKAAEQGHADAETWLGACYFKGAGVSQDYAEAVKWLRKSAEQGDVVAQVLLASCYENGLGVPQDRKEAEKWYRKTDQSEVPGDPRGNGTGFLIAGGYILTSYHVVKDASYIEVLSGGSRCRANLVKTDSVNDLALLRSPPAALLARLKRAEAGNAAGSVTNELVALPVLSSRDVHLGDSVFTLGFPNIDLQGIEPKLTHGEINSLSGIQDDLRFFQISAAVQPGNSGGALVDAHGNVIGIVEERLDDLVTLQTSGALPQNVNYALKSSFLIAFLDSVPQLAGKLKEPHTGKDRPFADVVKEVQNATVMVIVY
jgi:S1-C subfamily serine protease